MKWRRICDRKHIFYACVCLTDVYRSKPESAELEENKIQLNNALAFGKLLSALNNIFYISSAIKNRLSLRLPFSRAKKDIARSSETGCKDPRNARPARRRAPAGHAQRPAVTPLHPPVPDPTRPGSRKATAAKSLHAVQGHAHESHASANQASAPGTQDRASAADAARTEPRAPAAAPHGARPATLVPHALTKQPPKPPRRQESPIITPSLSGSSPSPAQRPSAAVVPSHAAQGVAGESPGPGLAQGRHSRVNATAPHSSVQKDAVSSPKARAPPAAAAPVALAPPAVNGECGKLWATRRLAGRPRSQICEDAHLRQLRLEFGAQDTEPKKIVFLDLYPKARKQGSLNDSVVTTGWPCYPNSIWKYRDAWRKEFTFADAIRQKMQQRMQTTLEQWRSREEDGKDAKPVVVGVHVRRTDHFEFLTNHTMGIPPFKDYNSAFEYYREKSRGLRRVKRWPRLVSRARGEGPP
nr:uncharacterized protein LOC113817516 isoform X2 [Penaeus vannamei]